MLDPKLTPEEHAILQKETGKIITKLVERRIPEDVKKELDALLSLIDNDSFRKRTWFSGYDDGFHTLFKYNIGIDTDEKPCYIVFYMSMDVSNCTTHVATDDFNNNFGSNGVIADLLRLSGGALISRVDSIKSLRETADLFTTGYWKLYKLHERTKYGNEIRRYINGRVVKILGDPQRQESSQLDKASVETAR